MTRVVVHIDELVLKGFRPEDRHAVAGALRTELARRLTDARAVQSLLSRGDVARLNVGTFRVSADARPSATGTMAAQSIVGGRTP